MYAIRSYYAFTTLFHGFDPVVSIAFFHTLFNLFGVFLWYPFISTLASFVEKFFSKEILHVTHFIHNVPTDVPELAIDALKKEIDHLCDKIEEYALLCINIPPRITSYNVCYTKLLRWT